MAKKKEDKNLDQIKKLNKVYFDLKMKHASLALKETHKLSETCLLYTSPSPRDY